MSIDQGGPKRYALGIDFGTSNTVAVARWPDGRARPILVDGSPLLPSAVYADSSGNLLVGRDAVHSARLDPARFEPNPKRRVDDGTVLLGEREFETVELIAAVLARITEEWHRAVGPYRPQTTLTCPASWGAARRTLLAEAAAQAGLEGARLVAEPVAAATYFAEVLGRDVPIGSVVMVHDFGAGTFDASVVARTSTGFEVLAVDGRDDLGGLDVDAAVVEHLRTDEWSRLMAPATVEERRARRQLWDDVRIAKERLSRAQSADFMVPLLDVEAHLTREELEKVARPVLDQTVRVTKNLLRWADLPDGRLAGVFLVGGASRIPLVATLLHRALGDPPVVIEQPELVVAEGSILAGAALLSTEPAAPGPTEEMRLPSKYLPSATGQIVLSGLPSAPVTTPVQPAAEPQETVVAAAGAVDAQRTVVTGAGAVDAQRTVVAGAVEPQMTVVVAAGVAESQGPTVETSQLGRDDAAEPDVAGGQETVLAPRPIEPATARSGAGEPEVPGGPLKTERLGNDVEPEADTVLEPVAEGRAPDGPGGALPKRARRPVVTEIEVESPDVPASDMPAHLRPPDDMPAHLRPLDDDMPAHLRPPVDPWPHADPATWRTDPDATAAAGPPARNGGWSPVPQRKAGPPQRANRPTTPVVAHARPISPVSAQPHPASSAKGSARPIPPGRAVAAAPRTAPPQGKQPKPAEVARPKRRRGRFLRFVQITLSLLTMLAVPLVALVLAYGYANGDPLEQDAINVFQDLAELLGLA